MKISVNIPTLNEASFVGQAIDNAWKCGADEVVLIDGGSSDDTVAIAESLNCIVCRSAAGRGRQLNYGAEASSGDVLLFLHVDSYLSVDGCDQIRGALQSEEVASGVFRQTLDNPRLIYRLIEFGNAMRVTWLGTAYGDQGLFIRRELFFELGGFDEIPLMEDLRFSQKLRQRNQSIRKNSESDKREYRFQLLPGPIHVSTRRWESRGPLTQTFANWRTTLQYMRGTDLAELARDYYGDGSVDPDCVANGDAIDDQN